jgi:hypothetical protein
MLITKNPIRGQTPLINARLMSSWFYVSLFALAAIYLILAYVLPPGADSLWRLHIAKGILEGKSLYHDFIEVNPPLWFWGALPAAFLGGYPALVAINLVASLAALWLFYTLLGLTLPRDGVRAATIGLACGLFLVNIAEIGQREQAFLVASALWCAMANARLEGKKIELPIVAAAVGFAAYGFALKHYFVLVPLAIEAILIWKLKRNWRPLRVENVALALLAALYAGAVLIWAPRFLGPILDLVQTTYFGFGLKSLNIVELQKRVIVVGIILVAPLLGWLWTRDDRPIIVFLLVALLMAFVAIVLQQKGWRYHLICAHGLSLITVFLMLERARTVRGSGAVGGFLSLSLLVLLYNAFASPTFASLKSHGEPINSRLAQIVASEPRDHRVAILSTAPDRAFYVLARAGRPHWTRHFSMWMMPGAITPSTDPVTQAKRLAVLNQMIGEFSADLRCTPPDLIVGEVGYIRRPSPLLFDSVALLQRNTKFADWLGTYYARQKNIGSFPIWRLKDQKPAPADCLKPQSQ